MTDIEELKKDCLCCKGPQTIGLDCTMLNSYLIANLQIKGLFIPLPLISGYLFLPLVSQQKGSYDVIEHFLITFRIKAYNILLCSLLCFYEACFCPLFPPPLPQERVSVRIFTYVKLFGQLQYEKNKILFLMHPLIHDGEHYDWP